MLGFYLDPSEIIFPNRSIDEILHAHNWHITVGSRWQIEPVLRMPQHRSDRELLPTIWSGGQIFHFRPFGFVGGLTVSLSMRRSSSRCSASASTASRSRRPVSNSA